MIKFDKYHTAAKYDTYYTHLSNDGTTHQIINLTQTISLFHAWK